MSWLKQILEFPGVVIKALRNHVEERNAKYTFEFDEKEYRTLRNGVVFKTTMWQDVREAILVQTDALTTESDNIIMICDAKNNFVVSDFSPHFVDFINFLDTPFPGLTQVSDTYFGSIVGKFGAAERLLLELKLGEAPKVIDGKVDHKQL